MKSLEQAIAHECKKQNKQPSELTHLELDNSCKIDSIKAVAPLTNLEVLSLASTGISSLDGFPALPKLRTLVLSDNKLNGTSLQYLVHLPALFKLDLANNSGINSLDALKPLQQLPALRRLYLDACPVKRKPSCHKDIFKMLTDLEYLDNVDKNGIEREADDDEEEEEEEEGEGEDGGDEGEEAVGEGEEGEEEDEAEPGPPLHAQLLEQQPLDDDEEDYEEEAEDDDDDEDPEEDEGEEGGAEEAPRSGSGVASGKKRKRTPTEPQGEHEEDDAVEEIN